MTIGRESERERYARGRECIIEWMVEWWRDRGVYIYRERGTS
jgi:hypothetical protein